MAKQDYTTAVIKTGGKQYLVTPGSRITVEKLAEKEGSTIVFPEVLLAVSDTDTMVGAPLVSGATVEGKIVRHVRAEKVTGVKMKAKKRYIRYFGHKQHLTEVEVTGITAKK